MFRISATPSFKHDVPIMVPVDGGHEERLLNTRFRVLPLAELEKFEPLSTLKNQTDFLDAVVAHFDDLENDSGKPIACTEEVKAQLLSLPYVRLGLMVAYERAVTKAKEKN